MAVEQHPNASRPDVYSSAHFSVEIDDIDKSGNALPTLRSVEGGGVKAEVINYQMGEHGDIWRQIGKPKYEPIKMTFGIADATGFWSWIDAFLKGSHVRHNGAIVAADHNYKEKARREFKEAIISEIAFPKWDAAAKDQANITVTIDPEKVEFKPPGSKTIDARDKSAASQKHITACNFDFSIDGYEVDTHRCTKIDAFSIKVKTIEAHNGNRLEPIKVPGKMEMPNLVFYVPEPDAAGLRALHNDRMNGIRDDVGKGRTGKLIFYNNQRQDRGELQFFGLHIFNVSSEKADANSEDMKLTKVECAVEKIEFKLY